MIIRLTIPVGVSVYFQAFFGVKLLTCQGPSGFPLCRRFIVDGWERLYDVVLQLHMMEFGILNGPGWEHLIGKRR